MIREAELEPIREALERAGFLPQEAQARLADEILCDKLETVLPDAMAHTGVDCWIIAAREYNEDPVMQTLFTWDMRHAVRMSVLMFFYDVKTGVLYKMSAGPQSSGMARVYRNVRKRGEAVWDCVARVVGEFMPRKIAVNESEAFGFCDGISAVARRQLEHCLPEPLRPRICSAQALALIWLQAVTAPELAAMRALTKATHDLIALAFSGQIIKPGETRTAEVAWRMRDWISQLGLDAWFGPDIDLQRRGEAEHFLTGVIRPGDLLHCDAGLTGKYVRLNTDIQRIAYVRREREKGAPRGLVNLLATANRMQDIAIAQLAAGRSGNEIFQDAMGQAQAEGVGSGRMLYTHPAGTFGHGAGPHIGAYDNQSGFVPVAGELLLPERIFFALELSVCESLPEWDNQKVFADVEEDIFFDGAAEYLDGRQSGLILI